MLKDVNQACKYFGNMSGCWEYYYNSSIVEEVNWGNGSLIRINFGMDFWVLAFGSVFKARFNRTWSICLMLSWNSWDSGEIPGSATWDRVRDYSFRLEALDARVYYQLIIKAVLRTGCFGWPGIGTRSRNRCEDPRKERSIFHYGRGFSNTYRS